jgi:hypothetical protein
VDTTTFKKLQAHVFDKDNPWVHIWKDKVARPNRLPYFSNWALYGENIDNNEIVDERIIKLLNPNVVFVALNFSKRLKDWGLWRNIRGNSNVDWLLNGKNEGFSPEKIKKYKGAYMTDLIKDKIGPVATKVTNELKQNEEDIMRNIGWFFEEIDLLGSDRIEMYLFGNNVRELFKNYVKRHEGFDKFRTKVIKCQHIYHYSWRNTWRFKKYTPEELELRASSTPEIRMLWNDIE